jgi:hypothetical protein
VRVCDSSFTSLGVPGVPGSSIPAVTNSFRYAGLQNLSYGSYLTGILQSLFHLPKFRSLVYSIAESQGVIREVQRLFGGMEIPSKNCSARLLMKAFGSTQNDVTSLRTPQEFLRLLSARLGEASPSTPDIGDLFAMKYIPAQRSIPNDFIPLRIERLLTLALDVRGSGSLEEAVSKFMVPQLRGQFIPSRSEVPRGAKFIEGVRGLYDKG